MWAMVLVEFYAQNVGLALFCAFVTGKNAHFTNLVPHSDQKALNSARTHSTCNCREVELVDYLKVTKSRKVNGDRKCALTD